MDRDSGTELSGIPSGELLVGTDVYSCKQRLRVRCLNACRLQLGGPHLIVEQRRRDEIFQVVVGLLFGLRMILRTITPTSSEIEGSLEDVAAHAFDIRCCQTIAALQ